MKKLPAQINLILKHFGTTDTQIKISGPKPAVIKKRDGSVIKHGDPVLIITKHREVVDGFKSAGFSGNWRDDEPN